MLFANKSRPQRSRLPISLLVGLLISVLLMALSFTYTAIQSQRYAQYINITDGFQILTLQLLKHSTEANKAHERSFTFLENSRNEFDHNIQLLYLGDENLPATPTETTASLQSLRTHWREYSSYVEQILSTEGVVRLQNEFVTGINEIMPDLIDFSDKVAQELINKQAHKRQIYLASRQLMLGQRIATNVNRLLISNAFAVKSAEQLQKDTTEFGKVLFGLLGGDKNLRLDRVRQNDVRDQLDQLLLIYETVDIMVGRILDKTPTLFKIHDAAEKLVNLTDGMTDAIGVLSQQYKDLQDELNTVRLIGFIMGFFSVIILVLLTMKLNISTRNQLNIEAIKNQRTQKAILTLLDEIAPIANGDLRVKATVSEEVTGAIADAINFTIDALRELVSTIDQMAREVHSSAEDTQIMSTHLTRASEQQSRQIEVVNHHIDAIADKMTMVSLNARESVNIAQQAMKTANKGNLVVQETIKSMHVIVDDIRDSSTRIKRLGETSQEIGDIVELINDIAEQTNILALNAAIKASTAGDGGVAFSGIADEVQQLAEQVAQATQKIESLVNNIQLDTAKAVESMEQSTGDVLSGTKLAETAGDSLRHMEGVSAQLSEFIHNVAEAAIQLNAQAEETRQNMAKIKNVAKQNVAGTRQAAKLAGVLAEKAGQQIKGLENFILPDQDSDKKT